MKAADTTGAKLDASLPLPPSPHPPLILLSLSHLISMDRHVIKNLPYIHLHWAYIYIFLTERCGRYIQNRIKIERILMHIRCMCYYLGNMTLSTLLVIMRVRFAI